MKQEKVKKISEIFEESNSQQENCNSKFEKRVMEIVRYEQLGTKEAILKSWWEIETRRNRNQESELERIRREERERYNQRLRNLEEEERRNWWSEWSQIKGEIEELRKSINEEGELEQEQAQTAQSTQQSNCFIRFFFECENEREANIKAYLLSFIIVIPFALIGEFLKKFEEEKKKPDTS